MKKRYELVAWVVTTTKTRKPRKFWGRGEWCFASLEEAEKYRLIAQRNWKESDYIVREVTVLI
jgi:hypothetical protein